jgi:hypothetical protein
MSRDASGTYTAPSNSANPAVNGTIIDPDDHNDIVDDFETALSESVFTGASSGTDNSIVRADGTSGKKVQEAGVTIDDSDNVAGVNNFSLGGYIDIAEISTPANPSVNSMRIYSVDNGGATELHFVDSAGNDVNLNNLNGTVTSVDIADPAAGITSSGGPITNSGSITLALANDLAALEGLSTTGIAERTGADTWQLSTVAALLEGVGSTQGQILYRDGSAWTVLAPGSVGQLLQTGGPGADPSWATVSGAGDVTAASAFATDNVVIRADGTGKGVQLSGLSIDDSDNLTGVNNVTGADANFVTGTAGTSSNLAAWDASGDAVDAGYNIPTGGTSGQALTKASDTDHDLEWATVAAGGGVGPNIIMNGDFQISQRGTTFTAATTPANDDDTVLVDRWLLLSDGDDIVDVSQLVDVADVPAGAAGAIKMEVQTANKQFALCQVLSHHDSRKAIGCTVSLSFDVKGITGSHTVRAAVIAWDGTTDSFTTDVIGTWAGGGTDPTLATNWTYENTPSDLSATTSWQTFTIEGVSVDTSGAKNVAVLIWLDDTTISTSDGLIVSRVKLEEGSTATSFASRLKASEFQMCAAYYWQSYGEGVAPGTVTTDGAMYITSATAGAGGVNLPFTHPSIMVLTPTITVYNPTTGAVGSFRSGASNISAVASTISNTAARIVNSASTTSGSAHIAHVTCDVGF